jgi:putative transposase
VGSAAPRRFSSAKEVSAKEKRRRRFAVPAQSKMRFVELQPPINLAAVSLHATPWPHAPMHQLGSRGTYFVTASTLHHAHHFKGKKRLAVLHRGVLKVAAEFGWRLEAWAIFSNHYHFVAQSPELEDDAKSLRRMLGLLHEKTAKWVNRIDRMPGRQVWFNFRETTLTYEKSYFARLDYTHQNAVKHGLVSVANQYPWCSARWFESTARPAQIDTIYRLKVDRLSVPDDFEVSPDW